MPDNTMFKRQQDAGTVGRVYTETGRRTRQASLPHIVNGQAGSTLEMRGAPPSNVPALAPLSFRNEDDLLMWGRGARRSTSWGKEVTLPKSSHVINVTFLGQQQHFS